MIKNSSRIDYHSIGRINRERKKKEAVEGRDRGASRPKPVLEPVDVSGACGASVPDP